MMMPDAKFATRAFRLVLAAPSVFAQAATTESDSTELTPMLITGSLIPTLDEVTPSPVDVFDAADIEKVNATDVVDLLRKTSVAFLGGSNIGQEVNNGGF